VRLDEPLAAPERPEMLPLRRRQLICELVVGKLFQKVKGSVANTLLDRSGSFDLFDRQLWMLLEIVVASALELPHGLADHVKSKDLRDAIDERLDFEFDFIRLDWLVAQGTALAGPVTTPHLGGDFKWQLSLCDTLTSDRPQF
jgi:hypothetical protein